jgi:hypothetical protein
MAWSKNRRVTADDGEGLGEPSACVRPVRTVGVDQPRLGTEGAGQLGLAVAEVEPDEWVELHVEHCVGDTRASRSWIHSTACWQRKVLGLVFVRRVAPTGCNFSDARQLCPGSTNERKLN